MCCIKALDIHVYLFSFIQIHTTISYIERSWTFCALDWFKNINDKHKPIILKFISFYFSATKLWKRKVFNFFPIRFQWIWSEFKVELIKNLTRFDQQLNPQSDDWMKKNKWFKNALDELVWLKKYGIQKNLAGNLRFGRILRHFIRSTKINLIRNDLMFLGNIRKNLRKYLKRLRF